MCSASRLLERTTRRVRPTEAGLAYYERCLDILSRVEETELQVARLHGEPSRRPPAERPRIVRRALSRPRGRRFHGATPESQGRADANRPLHRPDRGGSGCHDHGSPNFRIRASLRESWRRPGASSSPLPPISQATASHSAPEDLARHSCLRYGHTTTLQRWRIVRDGEPASVAINSVLCSNSGDVLRAAALAGRGVAFLPTFLVGRDIGSGPADDPRPLSAAGARHPCDLCVEPISRGQDARRSSTSSPGASATSRSGTGFSACSSDSVRRSASFPSSLRGREDLGLEFAVSGVSIRCRPKWRPVLRQWIRSSHDEDDVCSVRDCGERGVALAAVTGADAIKERRDADEGRRGRDQAGHTLCSRARRPFDSQRCRRR